MTQRISDGGRVKDILEVNFNSRGNLMIGDLGLRPREPYQTSKRQIVRTITNLVERLSRTRRDCSYLVPMSGEEYNSYCQQMDSQIKSRDGMQ
jgi:hypothetical protein